MVSQELCELLLASEAGRDLDQLVLELRGDVHEAR